MRDERTSDIYIHTLFSAGGAQISQTHCEILHNKIQRFEKSTQALPGFVKTHRHTRTCATTDLVGSSEKRDGSLEEGQVSTDGALSVSLSLFLCHRWTQSHLFLSHMPYSCIISVSVCARLTCLLSHKMGVS